MGHVLARLTGFGMVLVPHWPYAFERERDGSEAVRVTRWSSAGPDRAVIEPGGSVDGGTAVDVAPGPALPAWHVETAIFRVRWPAGFTVESPQDASDGTPFYLHGPGEATIFPQGPVARTRLADPGALVAPDQTVVHRRADGNGVTVLELSYRHDDEAWWQGHWTVPFDDDRYVVFTGQALEVAAGEARAAAEAVVGSFQGTR